VQRDWIEKRMSSFLDGIPLWIKPNHFSYLRIVLAIPVCYFLFWRQEFVAALFLYIIACITDFFDGALARKRNCCTAFGKRLDPVADKILNCLIFLGCIYFAISVWSTFKWILKMNIGVDILTTVAAITIILWKGDCNGANRFGKAKFGFQCVGVILLIFQCMWPAFITLSLAALLGIMSARGYLLACRR